MALILETGAVVTSANTYATVATVEGYCDDRLLTMTVGDPEGDAVSGEATADKEAAILRAMTYIESLNYKGVKTDRDNPLKWPRNGVEDIDGAAVESDEIPQEVINALSQAFYEEMVDPGSLQPSIGRDDLVKKEKIDVLETEYFEHRSPATKQFTIINDYLKGILESTSAVKVVRT